MSKGSPAVADPAATVFPAAREAAHEAVTRPINVPNQAGRRSRHPLRHALAWACQLTIFAAYVTGVYLAVAVGLGALTPWSADWRTALRLAAVAITAAGFSTLRRNVSVAVNRLVLPGPSRYEVLTSLAGRLRAAGPLEEALPSLARLLAEGTEARQAAVWLRSGPVFVRAAVWPTSPAPPGHHSFTQPAELGRRDDVDVFAPVRDGGEVLGVLSVALPAGRDPAPPDIRLVTDLANSAGSLLRNTLLTAELSQRLRTVSQQAEELHRSRRRLVAARDIARRRLVHELAVSVQAALDATRKVIGALEAGVLDAAGDTEALQQEIGHACALIGAARAETDALIARFRSVVHGIYPPGLSDYGLATAVENLAATLPRATRIAVRGLRRYPMEIESTVYFCATVALRALAARDHAVPLRVRLADTGRDLVLTIIDESRSGELGHDDRGLLDELGDHAGARGGTANAADIDGSLWLQAAIPFRGPPPNRPTRNPAPDYPTESSHPAEVRRSLADGTGPTGRPRADGAAEAGSRGADAGPEAIQGSAASTAPGRARDLGRRRWDVERLFNRALIYGLLVLLIGVLYVGLVIGADVLLGLPMRQNPLIQIAATAAVVLALAPARTMLSRLADRLAYGQRPPPDQVLARLSALSQATLSGVAALPSLARIVGDGLGARSCEVRLARPDGRLEIGAWRAAGAGPPAPGVPAPGVPAPSGRAPSGRAPGGRAVLRPGPALVSVPVVHRGVTVGDIRVESPAGGLAPVQRRLLGDLADGVSLVLRNARLAFELERRLAVISEQASTISASRWRIAAAQAQERQALERNLHDGAQPHLVAVRMSLGLAAHRLSSGPAISGAADLAAVLQGIAVRIDDANTSLAQVARGLYPAKLMEEGLCAALQTYVAAMPGEIALEFGAGTERARFGVEVEAAVCFACLEALQNARKHAPDAQIRLTLERDAGGLRFTVVDTGPGVDLEKARGFGLQSMDDRVAAVGGTLEFRSQPGAETTVSGWVPAEQIDESIASLTTS
jgi:signal transduction histidine kinase